MKVIKMVKRKNQYNSRTLTSGVLTVTNTTASTNDSEVKILAIEDFTDIASYFANIYQWYRINWIRAEFRSTMSPISAKKGRIALFRVQSDETFAGSLATFFETLEIEKKAKVAALNGHDLALTVIPYETEFQLGRWRDFGDSPEVDMARIQLMWFDHDLDAAQTIGYLYFRASFSFR